MRRRSATEVAARFFDGTIGIASIAENGDAVIRVADTQKFEFNADGTYQAHRCP